MPIKSCTLPDGSSGYKWGEHGTCYPDRAAAERQAAAAYASGYTEKGELRIVIADGVEFPGKGQYRLGVCTKDAIELVLDGHGRYILRKQEDWNGKGAVWSLTKPESQVEMSTSSEFVQVVQGLSDAGYNYIIIPDITSGTGELLKMAQALEKVQKQYEVPIVKVDAERRLVYGIVLEPDTLDSQDDTITAEEIELAAHRFMAQSRVIGEQHQRPTDAVPVESFIAPVDFSLGQDKVKKGSWVMVTRVDNVEVWDKIKSGDITGYSIGGWGMRTQEEEGSVEKANPDSTVIQTLVFSKDKFSRAEAVTWAKSNKFKFGNVDETDSSFRLRQQSPDKFKEDSFKTISLTDGVKAVIGHLQ